MRRALIAGCFLACLGAAMPAWGHPARTSAVFVDLYDDAVALEFEIPVDQLGLALDRPGEPVAALLGDADGLRTYLAEHVGARTPAGDAFPVSIGGLSSAVIDGAEHLVAAVELKAPTSDASEHFTLACDPVLHRVVSHKLFVSVRRDFRNGVFADGPEPVGVLRYQNDTLAIDRRGGSFWTGVSAVAGHGMRHIAEGTDHLLFVLVLLVVAPLAARAGRWEVEPSVGAAVRRILVIVTAFTLGHSLTLALGVLGVVRLPSRPVEIVVAVSILVSAVHAIRPLFAGRELWIAAGFGLVHGLAFATALADLGYGGVTMLASLVAFNLGIEVMQIAVIAATMPWLLMLRDTRLYTLLRGSLAVFAGVMAIGWILERAWDVPNLVAPAADALFAHAGLVLAALAGIALVRAVQLVRRQLAPGTAQET